LQSLPFEINSIFSIQSEDEFEYKAIEIAKFQYAQNRTYKAYVDLIGKDLSQLNAIEQIPFLPISFFKTREVKAFEGKHQIEFHSSGTTGPQKSKHFIYDGTVYQMSFLKCFELFFGNPEDYIVLGLLPSYHDNEHSSLIYMIDHLIERSKNKNSGFLLNDYERLINIVAKNETKKKIIVFGVSYALLDLAEKYNPDLRNCLVLETGGMKGRRKELTKSELHSELKKGLQIDTVLSEYGMTELLSQAYSLGNEKYQTPPWMKILIREQTDPLSFTKIKSGGVNVIDLANIYSCSFVATEDLGRVNGNQFEILGRFDQSDIRGCNLLIQ
jgi:phenylacetate-coenzyme A ligase PaaK-like adenylate-forming protein